MSRINCRMPIVLLFLLTLLTATQNLSACPNCKLLLTDSDQAQGADPNNSNVDLKGLADGFNYSVGFMLLVPLALATGFGSMFYLTLKNQGPHQNDLTDPNKSEKKERK